MSKALYMLLHTSVVSSLLILLIFFLRYIFKYKINTKLQYALWIIVALRLIIPFSYQWEVESKGTIPQMQIIDFALESNRDTYQSEVNHSLVERDMENYIGAENSQTNQHQYTLFEVLFIVWITGVISLFAILGFKNISFYKKTMKTIIPYNFSDNTYDEAAQIVGLKHKVPVYFSRSLTSPCVMGMFNPVIILTNSVINDTKATKFALIHEMVHYKQRDNLIRLLGNILCAVYWFNPLVWLSAEAARNDAELSCDSRVLEKISFEEHYNYCFTLLSVVGNNNQLVAAMSTGGKKMKKRIDMILKPPKNRTIAVLIVVICFALGISSFVNISVNAGDSTAQLLTENIRGEDSTDITSLGDIYNVYKILTLLPNPNDNYKINSITIDNDDRFKHMRLGYEFSKIDSVGGLHDDDIRRINSNALRLFSRIPDLNVITITYYDKQANSTIRNVKAPIALNYYRNQIQGEGDFSLAGDNIEEFSITPEIDNSFDQSWGGNNYILIYGHSEILSKIGIEKEEYEENSEMVSKLISTLGDYDDEWESHSSTVYRYSPNPVYSHWSDLMIITDEFGNLKAHGILLSDLKD